MADDFPIRTVIILMTMALLLFIITMSIIGEWDEENEKQLPNQDRLDDLSILAAISCIGTVIFFISGVISLALSEKLNNYLTGHR